MPYFDRLDYVAVMSQEHAFSIAIERALNLIVSKKASLIRILFLELTRILNHITALTTHALDVGALTSFLWMFEEREKLMEFYERVSGARLHSAYIRPGGVAYDISLGLLDDIYIFIVNLVSRIDELEDLLTNSFIWKQRLVGVGILTSFDALSWSCSGVALRGSGIPWDLRKTQKYELYADFLFKIPLSTNGDSYDRFSLRIAEMRQSLSLIYQCLNFMPISGLHKIRNAKISPPLFTKNNCMESLIKFFKIYTEGYCVQAREFYSCIESPKGEFGIFLVANSLTRPHRCKIRSPAFFHLQILSHLSINLFLSDLITLIGSLDLIMGEIDK